MQGFHLPPHQAPSTALHLEHASLSPMAHPTKSTTYEPVRFLGLGRSETVMFRADTGFGAGFVRLGGEHE